jgi:hypothetical protein
VPSYKVGGWFLLIHRLPILSRSSEVIDRLAQNRLRPSRVLLSLAELEGSWAVCGGFYGLIICSCEVRSVVDGLQMVSDRFVNSLQLFYLFLSLFRIFSAIFSSSFRCCSALKIIWFCFVLSLFDYCLFIVWR